LKKKNFEKAFSLGAGGKNSAWFMICRYGGIEAEKYRANQMRAGYLW